jgi:hypothetical protein
MHRSLYSLWTLLTLLTFNSTASAKEILFINEIVASNSTGITDVAGNHSDWFEIYNPNPYQIDLAGYYVSDNANSPTKFRIPAGPDSPKIPANGFVILWANSTAALGSNHTSFGLSAGGEDLVLYSPAQEFIDGISFGPQTADVSFGRQQNGGSSWVYFSTTTAGATNAGGVILQKLAPPVFSRNAGFHDGNFALTLTHSEPGVSIRYTLDGSEPVESTVVNTWKYKNRYNDSGSNPGSGGVNEGLSSDTYTSLLYTVPIQIINRGNEPNKVSMKTSSITYTPGYLPPTPIYKGTVVRVKVFKSGFSPSETITKTFFISPSGLPKYSVPVISVVSTETSFYDYTSGLFTPGITFDQYRATTSTPAGYCTVGNFTQSGELWERPGNIEFFDGNNPILNQQFNFRIHGGCSRSVAQKTLRLYSDTEFNFAVFPEKPTMFPKRLLLRNSGNDNNSTLFRDSFYQKLVRNLNFSTQLSRPAVVFINSEYWGFQNITERYDKYYLEKNYNLNRDNVDIIDVELPEIEEGDMVKYNELMSYANNNSLSSTANYNTIKTMMDVENFADYQIAEIFSANTDWPHKNTRLWRNRVPYVANANVPYGHDGRWRWMLYDTDISLSLNLKADANSIPNALNGGAPSVLLRRLFENAEFKNYFLNRLADLLNTTFLPSRSAALLAETRAIYDPLIAEHRDRWNSPPSVNFWNQSINEMRDFLDARPAYFRGHVRQSINGNLGNMDLNIQVNDATQGYVRVNTINILPTTEGLGATPYPWKGIYFQNNPMQLTAIAKPGFHFVQWERSGSMVSTNSVLPVTGTVTSLTYRAVFAAGALPVVLKSFDAKKQDNKVVINWETTSETNNDYFVVERSENARTWTPLATVKGSATTLALQQYKTTDEQPLPGINYYRLKQVDFDQTTTYSRMASVDMGEFKITGLWPNPVSDILNIKLDQSFEQGEYEITDVNGKVIRKRQKLSTFNPARIPVESLPVGIYILKIKTRDGASQSGKFVKE